MPKQLGDNKGSQCVCKEHCLRMSPPFSLTHNLFEDLLVQNIPRLPFTQAASMQPTAFRHSSPVLPNRHALRFLAPSCVDRLSYKSSLKPFYSIGLWSTPIFGKVQNPSSRACRSWPVSVSHHVVDVQDQRQLGSLHGHLHMLHKARWRNVLNKQDQRSALSHHSAATENLWKFEIRMKFGQNTGHDSAMHKMQQWKGHSAIISSSCHRVFITSHRTVRTVCPLPCQSVCTASPRPRLDSQRRG